MGGTLMFTTPIKLEGIKYWEILTDVKDNRPLYIMIEDKNIVIHALAAHFCELSNLSEESRKALFTSIMGETPGFDIDFKNGSIAVAADNLVRTFSTTSELGRAASISAFERVVNKEKKNR